MKDVYIVLVIIQDTVEVDSVFWNEKKAQKRATKLKMQPFFPLLVDNR